MTLKACRDTYLSVYFAIDKSGSMDWGTSGSPPTPPAPSRMDILKSTMALVFDQLEDAIRTGLRLDLAINFWAAGTSIESRTDATLADIAELRSFVDGIATESGTDFNQAVSNAVTWFTATVAEPIDRRVFIFITDGEPFPAGSADTAATTAADMLNRSSGAFSTADGTAVDMYGINILLADTTHTAKLDNTVGDGVPVVAELNSSDLADLLTPLLACISTNANMLAVFFRLASDPPLRLWCGINDIPIELTDVDADGAIYLGAGRLLNVPDLEVLINGIADRVEFYLPGVSVENSNRVAAEAPDIQGASVHIGVATLDDRYQPLTPIRPVWYGLADLWAMKQTMTSDPSQAPSRTLVLSVGSGRTGRARARRSSYTPVQQKLLHPSDLFCDFTPRNTQLRDVQWPVF